ncbi:MAG: hypothetical protein KGQ66_16610 [Acidobacteriota bacterium]|nr:hypothetical protein [Acidobacteriota bacterium]
MRRRFFTRGVLILVVWAAMNAALALIHFAFPSELSPQERWVYFGAVAILVVFALALFAVRPHRARSAAPPGGGRSANGAPAAAFAVACMIGGLAWVFGVFLAYLALPLIAFNLARLRQERAERREGTA